MSNFQAHFAELVVSAVLRLKGSGNLDYIQVGMLSASAPIIADLKHHHVCFRSLKSQEGASRTAGWRMVLSLTKRLGYACVVSICFV